MARALGIALLAGVWSFTGMSAAASPNRLAVLHTVLTTPADKIGFVGVKPTVEMPLY